MTESKIQLVMVTGMSGAGKTVAIQSFEDLGYVLSPGDSATFEANLLPDVHPNKPGRYRYFKEVSVGESRRKILMMAEFRLK